jgi:serine protease Do
MNNEFDNIIIAREQPNSRPSWKLLSVIAAGVLVVGTLLGSIVTAKGWLPFASANSAEEPKPAVALPSPALDQNIVLSGGFAQIAKTVTPAVVTIRVEARESDRRPFGFIDPFRDFFGLPDQDDESTPRRRTVPRPPQGNSEGGQNRGRLVPQGVGSGVLVTGDGYIITNNHVVEGAERVTVELNDRREVTAKVIGTDPPSDLAVIKIEGSNFPTVPFGDSENAQVGDLVLAVGNPLGVGQTVTMGIISAKGRSTSRTADLRNQPYEDFIQTDAAINRGNSGGALVNLRGELIGIPSQILAGGSGGSIGIGFAIPTKMARTVMDQLIKGGKVRRGKLGVIVRAISSEFAKELNYNSTAGAFVSDVEKGLPADQAGIKPYDIITEFNGKRITDSSELRNLTSQTAPGTPVKVKLWRDGSEPASKQKDEPALASANKATGPLAGVSVENLTPEKARQFRLPADTTGVVITDVDPNSDAAAAGLRPGLVILEVARQPVANVNEFNAALQKLGAKKSVFLRVRDGSAASVVLVQPQE